VRMPITSGPARPSSPAGNQGSRHWFAEAVIAFMRASMRLALRRMNPPLAAPSPGHGSLTPQLGS